VGGPPAAWRGLLKKFPEPRTARFNARGNYRKDVALTAFGEGTDKGETRAKPEIWKESAKYKEAADKMQVEMGKLNVAAKAGNIDALKAAFGPAAASCKACHDNFRKD
jgi:cytochrome c556